MGRLIDADRLKAHYCWWAGGSKEMSIDEAKKTFDTIIDIQPTVDAVPTEFHDRCMEIEIQKRIDLELNSEPVRHGRWCSTWDTTVKCSECGWFAGGKYNYCPHCGAKMDEVEDAKTN